MPGWAPGTFVPAIYRVREVTRELPDTATLCLEPQSGRRPSYAPGQFNMLYAFGIGEVAISISGEDEHGGFLHTVREVGAVSSALSRLRGGAAVGLRGPFGTAWPEAEGADLIFVAGGLGLAPLRPAIRRALARRNRYGRLFILFGTRHPDEVLYRHELEQWRRGPGVDLLLTVDHADAQWRGNVGVVPALIPRARFDSKSVVALVCGPEMMMRFSVAALHEAGVPDPHIYLSLERNMKCATGLCGHCQFGPEFICLDGPVMRFDRIAPLFAIREI